MGTPKLPQDVMLLICQELGASRDFTTLYHCSMVSRRVASIAVEQLYSVLEVMDPFIFHAAQSARLWRSIVLSSLGATRYPYCAYIRALSLSSLAECLDYIRPDEDLRQFFFEGLMQDFLVLQEEGKRRVKSTRYRLPPLDNAAITSRCADSIIQYTKTLADDNSTPMTLTHLEASVFPRDILPAWLSHLGALTSLQIHDGSVLGVEAASAIAEHCPNFSELTCFHCSSSSVDQEVAAFLLTLRPNTLQTFEILSRNNLNEDTLAALKTHSKSLRVLDLRTLLTSTLKAIHILSECTALETLLIEKEASYDGAVDLNEEELSRFAQWVSSCRALSELSFHHIRNPLPILEQVLQTSEIRLEKLHIQGSNFVSREVTRATWMALGQQKRLKSLTIASDDQPANDLDFIRYPELTDSICHLSSLATLNLLQSHVSSVDIVRITTALPRLEELSFGGDLFDESILEPLSKLHKLATLTINAITNFTYDGLWSFAQRLYEVGNRGIRVELLNQWYEAKLTTREEKQLNRYFAKNLKGQIAINYSADPNGLHEDDFSDSD
ncbi:hypothetical protein F4678DRAFT_416697 [Xylaria arbuscula]|nr:hypothetical protein F4678DRAFT_416697 [Xylaria arbuscula]